MLKPTKEQLEQIHNFFYLITENYENILLHPIIDEKTQTERLSICVVDRSDNSIYMLGFLFLPYDKLYERFSFKEPPKRFIAEKPGIARRIAWKIRKFVRLLWI